MVVGIIGGGQLGMMLAEALLKKGVSSIALDPNENCSCKNICKEIIVSEYNNKEKLEELAKKCDVLTYEFENIKSENLEFLVNNYNLKQGIKQLYISQDRLREKEFARTNGLNTPKFYAVNSLEEAVKGLDYVKLPAVLKTRTMGYDGHGQYIIKSLDDLNQISDFNNMILEELIKYDYETSIIMIRDDYKTVSLPMGINHHKDNILDIVYVDEEKEIFNKIKKDSYYFLEKANFKGIITIEFFVKDDVYYFNEIAPRPHNSGHYSIEACDNSQYDLFADYLIGNPLEEPKLIHKAIMKNILGLDYLKIDEFKEITNCFIHDYYKKEVKNMRKMAHLTFLDIDYDEYLNKYNNKFER